MPECVLAIDAGTTSLRAIVVDAGGAVIGRARETLPIHYPEAGRVEQDADHIWRVAQLVAGQALEAARRTPADLAALGVTTQRSSCVVWERSTGTPLTPLVSWQDLRGTDRSMELLGAGFAVLPQSAASKLESVLDGIPDGRARAERGHLAWGNIDSYLIARLSGGVLHITDPSQACATGYLDYETGGWNRALLETQELPQSFFPNLVDTFGMLGDTHPETLKAVVPIGAVVGDQQSAAIAQGCRRPGEGKVTFGTSGTANVHTGAAPRMVPGTYPLVLQRREGVTEYCLEGMVITAGAVFDWLSGGLGLLDDPAQAEAIGADAEDNGGVSVLPALQGLGSPYAEPDRRGLIAGLTRSTRKEHLVRAMLEGVAFRVREMLDAMYSDADLPRPLTLRADGGAAANDLLMQLQANILGQPVERMEPLEATAYGAAILAGRAVGLWTSDDVAGLRAVGRVFEPTWSQDERDARRHAWRVACHLV